jgi:arylsulfatase A-like enzyme
MRTGNVLPVRALIIGIVCFACAPSEPELPTNVVLIVIDDLGWTDTGVYGSTFYETPNIDGLAAGGARFTQFYTASPVCSPTRASLMTGRHPARLDLTNWIGGEQNGLLTQAEYIRQLPHEQVTIGEAFGEHGFATGYIGKWHLGGEGYLPSSQGFDFNFSVNEAGQPGSYFSPYENADWPITDVPDLEGDPEGAYLTDRLTDVALQFIETNRDRPFFLVLSHYAVHTPLQAQPMAVRRYAQKAAHLGPDEAENYESERESSTKLRQDHPTYAAMVESTDVSVGRILAGLADLGLDGRTVVVFVSDNGGLSTLARRGINQATANVPLRAGKGWLYDGGIRVPLIIRWPGGISAGTVVDNPALSMDLFPTILAMAGLPGRPDLHVDGTNLVGAMTGTVDDPHEAQYWHFPHYHGSGNRPGGAVRIGNLKLVEWFEDGSVELYDLAADPGERHDLGQHRPDDVARLQQALRTWRQEVGANMPTAR